MPEIDVTVYYLEMFSHPGPRRASAAEGVTVMHAKKPSAGFYRARYAVMWSCRLASYKRRGGQRDVN
ncbi:MAG TPA: hypothetical protein VFI31_17690 [Pirellulales bacterium]|nr:hypothetical protein [Pirellulales bacterium]